MSGGLHELVRRIVAGDADGVVRRVAAEPALAREAAAEGARWDNAAEFFFSDIGHHLYEGDTALHMAGAAFRAPIAQLLLDHGAAVGARNRRGAAVGGLVVRREQEAIIALLLRHGARPADSNAAGKQVVEVAGSPWIEALSRER